MNVKELCHSKKLSQAQLAKRCQVSRQTINAIKNDKYDPSLQLAFDLASVLESTVDELFIHESHLKD
ncbi:MAG: helix-turn-helix transcriptional regulator [Atopostipes sp.]|nr:helix-turn-helix transcriptional regulator [Atopostipes sp.]